VIGLGLFLLNFVSLIILLALGAGFYSALFIFLYEAIKDRM
jgi:hypothetical protein